MARSIWLRAGGAATALALLVMGFCVFAWLAQSQETTSFAYTGAVSRIVVVSTGDLSLSAGAAEGITGSQELTWSLVRPRVRRLWDPARQTLTLDVGCPAEYGPAQRCSAAFALTVPPDVTVQATARGGDIDVQGIRGALTLSSGGDISAHGTVGPITAITGAGNVTVDGSASPAVTAVSTAGNVTTQFSAPPTTVVARTVSGNVEVDLPPGGRYAVTAVTVNGTRDAAQVGNAAGATRRITAESTSGNVTVAYAS
jgi:hypothetical protein